MNQVTWPTIEEIENETSKAAITAMALTAWGNCHAGNKPPEHFGMMMVAVGKKLGISPTDENILRYAKNKEYNK
jgi:hypothetical protein